MFVELLEKNIDDGFLLGSKGDVYEVKQELTIKEVKYFDVDIGPGCSMLVPSDICLVTNEKENEKMESTVTESQVENTELEQEEIDENETEQEVSSEAESSESDQEVEEVESTPLSEAENSLIHIQNAERLCRVKEAAHDSAKEDVKFAKADYENAVAKLRTLAAAQANDDDRPLFNKQSSCESESDSESEAVDPETWKDVPIDVLWLDEPIKGFGKSKQELLIDEVSTLGGFEKLRMLVGKDADHLSKLLPKGCGESLADELEERQIQYIAKTATTEGDNESFFMDRIAEFEKDENWLNEESAEDEDVYQLGKTAFEDGGSITACPFLESPDLNDWLAGYWSAKLTSELEEAENLVDSEEHENESGDDEYEDVEDDSDVSLEDL